MTFVLHGFQTTRFSNWYLDTNKNYASRINMQKWVGVQGTTIFNDQLGLWTSYSPDNRSRPGFYPSDHISNPDVLYKVIIPDVIKSVVTNYPIRALSEGSNHAGLVAVDHTGYSLFGAFSAFRASDSSSFEEFVQNRADSDTLLDDPNYSGSIYSYEQWIRSLSDIYSSIFLALQDAVPNASFSPFRPIYRENKTSTDWLLHNDMLSDFWNTLKCLTPFLPSNKYIVGGKYDNGPINYRSSYDDYKTYLAKTLQECVRICPNAQVVPILSNVYEASRDEQFYSGKQVGCLEVEVFFDACFISDIDQVGIYVPCHSSSVASVHESWISDVSTECLLSLSKNGVYDFQFQEKDPDAPLKSHDTIEPIENLGDSVSIEFGADCTETMLYEPDHRPVRVYDMYTGDVSEGNPDGLAAWWSGENATSILIQYLNRDYSAGYRRFMFYMPGGSRSSEYLNPNHWYSMGADKRQQIRDLLIPWLQSRPAVEICIYTGFLIDPLSDPSLTTVDPLKSVIPDLGEILHANYLNNNWSPWFDIGVRSLVFHDSSQGDKSIALKNLAYAYSFANIKIRGNGIPVLNSLPNSLNCEVGWIDSHSEIVAKSNGNLWVFDPSVSEVGVFLRAADNLTKEEVELYAQRGYTLHSFGAWFDELVLQTYVAYTTPLLNGEELTTESTGLVFETVTEASTDPIKGFGVVRSVDVFGGAVGDSLPQNIDECTIVCIANSVDGTFEFNEELSKYRLLEIDIKNTQFNNTSLSHTVVEDTIEWTNAGLPSHLGQVQHSNIVNVGIVHERNFPGLQESISTPYQALFKSPCSVEWFDQFNSTIANDIAFDSGNLGVSLSYAVCVLYLEEMNEVWVGGIGGIISIDVDSKDIESVVIDSRRSLDVQSMRLVGSEVFILCKTDLYIYDLSTGISRKDSGLGLPKNLYSFAVALSNALVVGGEDGIYARRPTQDDWTRVAETSKADIISSPDYVFVVAEQQILYSTDGFTWNSLGNLRANTEVNALVKHRAQVFVATTEGLFEDNGSFYGNTVSVRLVDILGDIELSADIPVNDVQSNFDRAVIGLSDGRYVIYETDYVVYEDCILETIHKVLLVGDDIWLFGFDNFQVMSENRIRKLATGGIVMAPPASDEASGNVGGSGSTSNVNAPQPPTSNK